MPRGDRTGPRGMGPMTGRAAGYCAGSSVPGYANPGPGMGTGGGGGYGYGRGMGRRWWCRGGGGGWWRSEGGGLPVAFPVPAAAPVEERSFVEAQIEGLKAQLQTLSQRLAALTEGSREQAGEQG